jgi:hypothetical protein
MQRKEGETDSFLILFDKKKIFPGEFMLSSYTTVQYRRDI